MPLSDPIFQVPNEVQERLDGIFRLSKRDPWGHPGVVIKSYGTPKTGKVTVRTLVGWNNGQ